MCVGGRRGGVVLWAVEMKMGGGGVRLAERRGIFLINYVAGSCDDDSLRRSFDLAQHLSLFLSRSLAP